MTSLFELEFEYGYDKTHLDLDTDTNFAPDTTFGDLRLQYYMGYATFNFGHSRLVPYFTIGGGAANLKPEISGVNTSSDTRFTAGDRRRDQVLLRPALRPALRRPRLLDATSATRRSSAAPTTPARRATG